VENRCLELYSASIPRYIHRIRPVSRDCEARDLHISACVWPIIMFHPVFNEWLHYRWSEASWSWLSVIMCFEKSTAHARGPRALYSSYTQYRRVRAFMSTWHAHRYTDKIGDDCNFSQRRQSLREPLIIGPPGIYTAPRQEEGRKGVERGEAGGWPLGWILAIFRWSDVC